jgi:hypothetical protein
VSVSPNLAVTDQNRSWGYFNKATTNFPFAKGIVLTTGYARKAGNDLQGTLSDGLGSEEMQIWRRLLEFLTISLTMRLT